MLATARFEGRRRLPASALIAVGLSAFAAMMVFLAPSLLGEVDLAAFVDQYPPALVDAFDLAAIGTIEGFIALELYQFVWLLGLGGYVAYSAAGTVAGDIEDDRLDTLLAAPVSRARVLGEKFLALAVPIVLVNVAVFVAVAAGTRLVNEPVALVDLLAVHALSVPYLLCCGAWGMLASVAAPRRSVAEGVAAGAVVAGFVVSTATAGTDVSWLGALSPTRYYDPLAILTASEYDLGGAAVLTAAAALLLVAAVVRFRGMDVQ
ncbi:ABC transporter permease subunit [Halobaculum marinum]|uniref:ABC transporter permease subunit n=1 Tax=Halobaculum marinum TaxID=3031996 RepID=A0ABD5WSB7_9EURY|nr:ABC transporter permease subunit [Halobaculum sp. DT55]